MIMGLMSIAIAALLVAVAVSRSDGGPVGYFDPNRVFSESAEARSTMRDVGHADQLEAARQEAERAAMEAAHADETTAAAKKEKAEATANAYRALDHQRSVAAEMVNGRIAVAVAKIATARRMTLVLPISGTLPYASPRADLTGEVTAALDGTSGELVEARRAEHDAAQRVRQLEAARPPPAPAIGKAVQR